MRSIGKASGKRLFDLTVFHLRAKGFTLRDLVEGEEAFSFLGMEGGWSRPYAGIFTGVVPSVRRSTVAAGTTLGSEICGEIPLPRARRSGLGGAAAEARLRRGDGGECLGRLPAAAPSRDG